MRARNFKGLNQLFVLLTSMFAVSASLQAHEDSSGPTNAIGLGMVIANGIYEGQDNYVYPWPALNFDFNDFFGKEATVGYRAFKGERSSLSFAATVGHTFLDINDIDGPEQPLYAGISDRKAAIEAGLIFHYESHVGLVTIDYYRDVSGTHDAARGSIGISREIAETGPLSIVPGIFVNYYSAKYNRYYFEVTAAQNKRGADETGTTESAFNSFRRIYKPDNSGHFGFDINVQYKLTPKVLLNGHLVFEELTGPWETSPLVEDKGFLTILLGASYRF